jgi:DNA-binding transcriptional LysR family regulator
MSQTDNLADLFLLTLVVEAGGFSAAASRSGTTKSRLSRRIIQLEKRLRIQLLVRDARRFSLTPVGEQVYRQALLIREALQTVHDVADDGEGAQGGQIQVSANRLLLPILEGLLPSFFSKHPETRVQLILSDEYMDALLTRRADIVLYSDSNLPNSADVVARLLGAIEYVTVAHPNAIKQHDWQTRTSNLDHQHFLYHLGSELPSYLSNAVRRRTPARFASNEASAILAAARTGMGYAYLPRYLCQEDILKGNLDVIPAAQEDLSRPLYALTLRDRGSNRTSRTFVEFLREYLSSETPVGITPSAPR